MSRFQPQLRLRSLQNSMWTVVTLELDERDMIDNSTEVAKSGPALLRHLDLVLRWVIRTQTLHQSVMARRCRSKNFSI